MKAQLGHNYFFLYPFHSIPFHLHNYRKAESSTCGGKEIIYFDKQMIIKHYK